MYRTATVAQINAYAAKLQVEAGRAFTVRPNSHGTRAECNTCHESATHDRAERFIRNHTHAAARTADFEEVTHNADGTINRVLYYV